MRITTSLLLAIVAACAAGPAAAARPDSSHFFPPSASRIVGHWQGEVTIGPCAGGPQSSFITNGVFNLGGTLAYTSTAIPPAGVSPTFGTWSADYDRGTRTVTYHARMQFHRYATGGVYDGIQDVHRTMSLSSDAQYMTETVVANVLNVDGSLRVKLCGTSTDRRIVGD